MSNTDQPIVMQFRERLKERIAYHAPVAAPFDDVVDDDELRRKIQTHGTAWRARCIQLELRDVLKELDALRGTIILPDVVSVTVTAGNIAAALRCDTTRGPISEALVEMFPGYTCEVTRHDRTIDLISEDLVGKQYELPENALRWLESFDRCDSDGEPITFTMYRV